MAPLRTLDGFGVFQAPPPTAKPISWPSPVVPSLGHQLAHAAMSSARHQAFSMAGFESKPPVAKMTPFEAFTRK